MICIVSFDIHSFPPNGCRNASTGSGGKRSWEVGWEGGRDLQTIVVCRCCREASQATISSVMLLSFPLWCRFLLNVVSSPMSLSFPPWCRCRFLRNVVVSLRVNNVGEVLVNYGIRSISCLMFCLEMRDRPLIVDDKTNLRKFLLCAHCTEP
jgi:hypothetical protein